MEIFKDSRFHPYHLGRVFYMPTNDGGVPAIAVSYTTAKYLLSAHTFLVLLIFAVLWKIYVNLAMRFYPSRSKLRGNRYVAIAGLASSADAWSMGFLIVDYCWTMFSKAGDARSGFLAVLVLVGSIVLGTSRIAAGIIFPARLIIGNAAPVDASFIFLPHSLDLTQTDHSMVFFRTIVQNSAQLATSYLANVQETLLEPGPNGRVSINFTDLPPRPWGKSVRMDYRYKITGVDLGLQFASELSKTIDGSCETIYNFTTNETWSTINGFGFNRGGQVVQGLTPAVPFTFVGEGLHYVLVINVAGIDSFGESDDPWYSTGPAVGEGTNQTFKVLPDKPVVYCSQNESWTYKASQVKGNSSIAELPGLNLKPVIMAYLQNDLNRLSPIALMPLLLGDRMLLSSSTSVEDIFDASIYTIRDELTRLIALSFLLEGDILRRTVTNNPQRTKFTNPALMNGIKADGVDDFVLHSSDVVTISLKILIATPVVLLIILLVLLLLGTTTCTDGNRGSGARYHIRRTAFNPMQMYRHIDETTGGNHIWKGRTSTVPYVMNRSLHGGNMPAEITSTESPNESLLTALGSDAHPGRISGFVAPKVVDRQGRTPGADIEFTRTWDPSLSVPWKEVGVGI